MDCQCAKMSTNDQYALNWSNHTNHIRKAFDTQLAGSDFVDVTLSCEGKKISAHKMLLSACSPYFYDLFRDNPCQHPIVILRDVKFQNLLDILKFMYNGEVSVATENFDSFLKTAELLQVSGLTDDESRFGSKDKQNSTNSVASEQTHTQPQKRQSQQNVSEGKKTKDISKRSFNDTSSNGEEGSSQVKRRKEEEVKSSATGPVVKEEDDDVIDLDDDQMQEYEGDPLDYEQNESVEGADQLLQPSKYTSSHLTQFCQVYK